MTLWEFRFLENLDSAWSPVVQNLSLLCVCIHILYFSRKATNNNTNVKVTQLKACWPRWATRFYIWNKIWNKCLCYALSVDSRTKVKRKDLFSLHGSLKKRQQVWNDSEGEVVHLRPREDKQHHFGTKATWFETEMSASNTSMCFVHPIPKMKNSVTISDD